MSRCYRPARAYQYADGSVSFAERPSCVRTLRVRCGRCVGCRMASARSWSIRCAHEARLFDENAFLTLTYDDAYLPAKRGLQHEDVQKFLKRVRKIQDARYFMCGEYGPSSLRPHYHMLLFGGSASVEYEEIWGLGHVKSDPISDARIAYVTGYTLKESPTPPHDGVAKPYRQMSRRPGLGSRFFEKYRSDFDKDYAIWDGRKVALPAYYRRKLDDELLEELDEVRARRRAAENEVLYDEVRAERAYPSDVIWRREVAGERVAKARVRTFQSREAI